MSIPWRRFLIHSSLIPETERFIRSFWGREAPREGLVYWGGRRAGQDVLALTAFAPRASSKPFSVETSEDANTDLIRALRGMHLTYVAQVHSHPPGVEGHSPGDDRWAFMKHEGLVSIVAQDFGQEPLWPLRAVHVFTSGRFLTLDSATIHERIALVPPCVDLRESPG